MPISVGEPRKESRKLRKAVLAGFIVVPLLFCGIGALVARRWVDVFDYSSDLDRLVDEAKKRNLPLTAKDLQIEGRNPSKNAKKAILAAMKDERLSAEGRKSLTDFQPKRGASFPSDLNRIASTGVEISRHDYFDGEKDRDLGIYVRYPEYGFFKDAAKALALRAQQNACDGKSDDVLKDLSAIRDLAGLLKDEKQIIGGLVNLALNQIFIRASLRSGQMLVGHPFEIERIKSLVAKDLPPCPFQDCFAGEFYNGITLARNYSELGGARGVVGDDSFRVNPDRLTREGLPKNIIHRGMLAAYIRHSIFIVDVYRSEKNLFSASQKVDKYTRELPKTVSNVLPIMMLPIFSQAGVAWERQGLTQKMATASLDLLAKGKFPEAIPAIEDTLGGGTIMYRLTQTGFVIYSKGRNAKDEGGPRNKTDRKNSDDIGFEYPVVPSA